MKLASHAFIALVICLWFSAIASAEGIAEGPVSSSAVLKPPPGIELAELGGGDKRLIGLTAPRGLKVEVVAEHPALARVAGLAFADDGSLRALTWTDAEAWQTVGKEIKQLRKATKDELISLQDSDADGTYDDIRVVMSDLELPSGLLLTDGWTYFLSQGRLLRRRAHEAEALERLRADAERKKGPPTQATADGRWIEQQLADGFSAFCREPVGGLTIGPGGWLYVTASGSQPSRVRSWDGSRANISASAGVFRMRLDGSDLSEFSRGMGCATNISFDELGNAFALDRFQPSAKAASVGRLIQVLEGADFGWRRDRAASSTPDCRGAADEGRTGTLPSVRTLSSSGPRSLSICCSEAFPDFLFRGLAIYCDPANHAVRACQVARKGPVFEAKSEFDLLKSDQATFQPSFVLTGPDGAIYFADRQGSISPREDDRPGRIYRLTWSGTDQAPAVAAGSLQAWSDITEAADEDLWRALDGEDHEVRQRAARELLRRVQADPDLQTAMRPKLIARVQDKAHPTAGRIAAIYVAAAVADDAVHEALLSVLADERAEIRTAVADAIAGNMPADRERVVALAEGLQHYFRFSDETASERPMRLALARLAAASAAESAEWGFESASVSHLAGMTRHSFDAHVRALELIPGAAADLMIGNLEVALFLPEAEPQERQRLKEFVTLTAESMRTRELALFLEALLKSEQDIFAKLDAPLEQRLIAAYRNIEADPPIHADLLLEWIEKHPGGPVEVDVAALETMAAVGISKPDGAASLAERLLQAPDETQRLVVVRAIGKLRLTSLAKALTTMLADTKRSDAERRAIEAALEQLK